MLTIKAELLYFIHLTMAETNLLDLFSLAEHDQVKFVSGWWLVVSQLVVQSLPPPEICGSNPVIANSICIAKTKINKKSPGMAQFLKISF